MSFDLFKQIYTYFMNPSWFKLVPNGIASFSQGWLDVLSLEPISTEMLGILLRFAVEFNLSYTRFLDLQIAEKQARAWD